MQGDSSPASERVQTYTVDDTSGCWNFDGLLNNEGYGRYWVRPNVYAQAHRVYYERLVGPVPEGLVLDHDCRNHACVNPAHLEPVTNRVNILRGVGITARNAAKTHCDHGHELIAENVYEYRGWRMCRECRRRVGRESAARRRKLAREASELSAPLTPSTPLASLNAR